MDVHYVVVVEVVVVVEGDDDVVDVVVVVDDDGDYAYFDFVDYYFDCGDEVEVFDESIRVNFVIFP